MGTRNLTCVMLNGEYRVAQYGQWDGYPSGQGKIILEFLKRMDKEKFIENLKQSFFITTEEQKALWKEFGADDSDMVTMEVSKKFNKVHPQLSRDMGGAILEFIQDATEPVQLADQIEFATDGLFCEWAYVVDLDKNTLEVYSGFGQRKLPEGSRFGNDIGDNGYSAVGLVTTYSLDGLPSYDCFLADLEPSDEDETMSHDAIVAVIDEIRKSSHGDELITDRICNYMEANINEFIETYEMVDFTE